MSKYSHTGHTTSCTPCISGIPTVFSSIGYSQKYISRSTKKKNVKNFFRTSQFCYIISLENVKTLYSYDEFNEAIYNLANLKLNHFFVVTNFEPLILFFSTILNEFLWNRRSIRSRRLRRYSWKTRAVYATFRYVGILSNSEKSNTRPPRTSSSSSKAGGVQRVWLFPLPPNDSPVFLNLPVFP